MSNLNQTSLEIETELSSNGRQEGCISTALSWLCLTCSTLIASAALVFIEIFGVLSVSSDINNLTGPTNVENVSLVTSISEECYNLQKLQKNIVPFIWTLFACSVLSFLANVAGTFDWIYNHYKSNKTNNIIIEKYRLSSNFLHKILPFRLIIHFLMSYMLFELSSEIRRNNITYKYDLFFQISVILHAILWIIFLAGLISLAKEQSRPSKTGSCVVLMVLAWVVGSVVFYGNTLDFVVFDDSGYEDVRIYGYISVYNGYNFNFTDFDYNDSHTIGYNINNGLYGYNNSDNVYVDDFKCRIRNRYKDFDSISWQNIHLELSVYDIGWYGYDGHEVMIIDNAEIECDTNRCTLFYIGEDSRKSNLGWMWVHRNTCEQFEIDTFPSFSSYDYIVSNNNITVCSGDVAFDY